MTTPLRHGGVLGRAVMSGSSVSWDASHAMPMSTALAVVATQALLHVSAGALSHIRT